MTTVLIIVVVLIATALVALLVIWTVQIVPQARAANVERFGRYRRILKPGLNFVVPFVDRVKPLIELREQVVSSKTSRSSPRTTWWSTSTPCCSSR